MRTINIHLDAGQVSDRCHNLSSVAFNDAIAYLTLWCYTYPVVDIYSDGLKDLIACYRTPTGTNGFTIGAIWREGEGKYSFHS